MSDPGDEHPQLHPQFMEALAALTVAHPGHAFGGSERFTREGVEYRVRIDGTDNETGWCPTPRIACAEMADRIGSMA